MEMQFIDGRNRSLWESINQHFRLRIENHSNHHFFHYFKDQEVYLFVPEEGGTPELFTHELLHLDLIVNGVTITSYLKDRLRNEPLLHWTFSENLFEQIGNCLEHSKMLPLYLEMSFERDLFSESYHMPCCTNMSMQMIRSGMGKEIPARASIDLFIHKFFAMKACLNPEFNYEVQLEELRKINEELYAILDQFWQSWEAFDISNSPCTSFKLFTYDFMHRLGTWNILNVYAKEKMRA